MRGAVFTLLLAFSAAAYAQDLRAPLPIRDQFLLNNGFFFFEPERAAVLDDEQWRLTLNTSDSNTFAKSAWITHNLARGIGRADAGQELSDSRFRGEDPLFLADGETHRFELAVRRGFGAHLELGLTLPITRIGGGWSDVLVEDVHRALGVGNAGRETLRQNSETVFIETASTMYLRDRSAGYSIGDIALNAKYELAPRAEGSVHMALAGAIELPAGNAQTLAGSGSFDAGVEMIVSRDFAKSALHVSTGVVHLGGDRVIGSDALIVVSGTIAGSRMISDRSSVVVQLTISQSPLRHLGPAELTHRSNQLSVGMQHQIGRTAILYVALIENVLNYENSADAGLAWGITRRF
ncbi:MAG TPA: DUF3187 family protein [Thermoanaerobaculia bacterium]|nr:DUF3187 family protein [Thermoanaerobaculia bacterium]